MLELFPSVLSDVRPKLSRAYIRVPMIAPKSVALQELFINGYKDWLSGVSALKFHQVRALLAIDDAGSIRLAARKLNVTQPALSKSIAELEKELGIPLFNRSSSGATITSWGRSILERCRTIDAEIQSISEDATQLRENWSGRLRVGIVSIAAGQEVVNVMRNLRRQTPGIQISVHELRPQTVIQFVREGIIDIGITTTAIDNSPHLISSELVCRMNYVIVGSKKTIASIGDASRLDQVTDLPWVNASEDKQSESHFYEIFDQAGVKRPSDWINCSSAFVALELVKNDGFLCFWPSRAFTMMRDRLDFAQVDQLKLEHPLPEIAIWIVYKERDLLTEPARKFISHILEVGFCGEGQTQG